MTITGAPKELDELLTAPPDEPLLLPMHEKATYYLSVTLEASGQPLGGVKRHTIMIGAAAPGARPTLGSLGSLGSADDGEGARDAPAAAEGDRDAPALTEGDRDAPAAAEADRDAPTAAEGEESLAPGGLV